MAAEINARDIASRGALEAPLILKKNVDEAIKSIDKLLKITRQSEANISIAKSILKVTNETNNLTKAQQGLSEVQKKVALNSKTLWLSENEVANAQKKMNEEIKKTGTVLNDMDRKLIKASNSATMLGNSYKKTNEELGKSKPVISSIAGEYKKLVSALNDARNKYKDMAASGKATEDALRRQQKVFEDLNKKVVVIDKSVGQFQRNVGNYPAVFGTATRSIVEFMGAFGLVTGMYLFAKAFKDIVAISIEFESANSRLAGVMGKTTDEIKNLREQQLALAKTTLFNAAAYAELQIELAKLGFPIDDIERMTESTAKASIAMGSDLARQAELTGSVLHQYGLDANQVGRVNDALSKSTTASALDFDKLATALPYVGSAANALGFSLEETLALMGQLANTGLQASTIGTSLRKIFLLMADSSSKLSRSFKEPVRSLPQLLKGLKELKLDNTELAETLELTDVRSVIAFQSLLDGAEKVETLNKVIGESIGFTNELAHTVKDNLGGDVKLAGSAIDSLAISIGEKLDGAMRLVVQSFTSFIRALQLLPAFIRENKDLMIALVLAILALNGAAIKATLSNISLTASFRALRTATLSALAATRAFFVALLTNPFTIVLLALAAVIVAIGVYDRTSRRAISVLTERNKLEKELAETVERTDKAQSNFTKSTQEWIKLSKEQRKSELEQLAFNIKLAETQVHRAQIRMNELGQMAEELTMWQKLKVAAISYFDLTLGIESAVTDSQENRTEATKDSEEAIKRLQASLEELKRIQLEMLGVDSEVNKKEKDKNKDLEKSYFELENYRLKIRIENSKKISDNENQSTELRIAELKKQEDWLKKIAKNERIIALMTKDGKELDASEKLLIEETYQNALTKLTIDGENERGKIVREGQLQQLEKAKNAAIEAAKIRQQEVQREMDAEITQVQKAVLAGIKTREQGDKEILRIEAAFGEELIKQRIAEQKTLLEIDENNVKDAISIIQKSSLEQVDKDALIMALKEQHGKRQKEIIQEIYDLEKDLSDAQYNNKAQLFEKEIEFLENLFNAVSVYGSAIVNLFSAISDRRVSEIDSQMKASNEFYENEIRLAGDNERSKQQLQAQSEAKRKEFEKQRIAAMRKAAIFEKGLALTQAGIQTSLNILKAAGSAPPPFNIPAIAAATILGALQIAAIAAKPLPQYAEGTPEGGHIGGAAIVGEKGTELGVTPDGKTFVTPSKATVMNLPKGTEIYPNDTLKMLAHGSMNRVDSVTPEYALYRRVDSLEKAIRETNGAIVDAIIENTPDYAMHGSLLLKIQKKRDGSKKITHSRVMGY